VIFMNPPPNFFLTPGGFSAGAFSELKIPKSGCHLALFAGDRTFKSISVLQSPPIAQLASGLGTRHSARRPNAALRPNPNGLTHPKTPKHLAITIAVPTARATEVSYFTVGFSAVLYEPVPIPTVQ
jgi:hypothetical protein